MSKVNLELELDKNTAVSHIILESGEGTIRSIVDHKDYDLNAVDVEIKVCGVPVTIDNFNTFVDDLCEQIRESVKYQMGADVVEERIKKEAVNLVKDKLGNIQDILCDVENSLWKLED